jgi:hypothetical protein
VLGKIVSLVETYDVGEDERRMAPLKILYETSAIKRENVVSAHLHKAVDDRRVSIGTL